MHDFNDDLIMSAKFKLNEKVDFVDNIIEEFGSHYKRYKHFLDKAEFENRCGETIDADIGFIENEYIDGIGFFSNPELKDPDIFVWMYEEVNSNDFYLCIRCRSKDLVGQFIYTLIYKFIKKTYQPQIERVFKENKKITSKNDVLNEFINTKLPKK